jgi:DNA-binding winged helix-turn-helix (wHTH) protein
MSNRLTSCPKDRRAELAFDTPTDSITEFLTDIDGVPVLVRFVVANMPATMQSDFAVGDADLRSLASAMVEKAVEKMGGASVRRHDHPKQALATIELISNAEHLTRLPAPSNDTLLRVGPLELDLIDRTAKRGDRRIDLRPREFQLLKYMMQRSEKLLTRAALLKEVWNYKFVPETNLIDVHMGKLRRKVDGPNEPALIRNIRGAGFVLSATPFCSMPGQGRRTKAWLSPNNPSRPLENVLQ